MILAMPYKHGNIDGFDDSKLFALYHLENNQVVKKDLIKPNLVGEELVEFLYRSQVNQLMVPLLSDDLKFELDFYQIDYISGVSGEADELIDRYLEGEFQDDE